MTLAGGTRPPRVPRTFVRYVGVGVLSFVVDAGTLWLLYDVAHTRLWLATTVGFWLGFAVNFLAHKYVTFAVRSGGRRQLRRYVVVVGATYLANLAIVTGLVHLGLPAVVSKVIAVGLLLAVSFSAYRLWVFRHEGR